MSKIAIAILVSLFTAGSAMAFDRCTSIAVNRGGKPVAGAALVGFLKKCRRDACGLKAVSMDGKPLSGASKSRFMKKCRREAA